MLMLDVLKATPGLQMLPPEDPEEEEPDEPVRGADAIIRAQMVCIHGLTRLITDRLHSQVTAKRAACDARLEARPCVWALPNCMDMGWCVGCHCSC